MVEVSLNIKTGEQARAELVNLIKTPPKTPLDAALWLTKNISMSANLGKAIFGSVPGVGSIIGALTDIFSVFEEPPSLGSIVMDGLKSISTQMQNISIELNSTIQKTAEIQTQRVSDFTLQIATAGQMEVSAMQIMQSISDETGLKELAIQKNAIQAAYLAEYEALQKTAYSEIENIINANQADLKKLYDSIMLRFGSMGLEFYDFLKSETTKPTQATQSRAVSPGATQQADATEPATGFNWLYLTPLALLLFMDKKK